MIFYKLLTVLMLILILAEVTAQDTSEAVIYSASDFSFPYQVNEPDMKWELPSRLVEISGLAFIDEERLACVQDEKGNIYIFNQTSGEIDTKIDFGDNGDYEGLTLIDQDAWIVKSNGNLYRVKNFMEEENNNTKKYHTGLSRKNEPEGIAYDLRTHSLLISCKGAPYIDDKSGKDHKAVYSFDVDTRKLKEIPTFIISLDTIKSIRDYNTMTRLGLDLLASLDESKGDVTFQPSGIAVHPITGHVYMVGAVGNLMLVLDYEGTYLAIIELKSKMFLQPEGICFSPSGDLYIANEGKDRKATIFMFNLHVRNVAIDISSIVRWWFRLPG